MSWLHPGNTTPGRGRANRRPGGPVATSPGCSDCGGDVDLYTVHDDVWFRRAKARSDMLLCIRDLERRLGRRLTAADFNHAPCNDPGDPAFPKSHALRERLRGWIPAR